MSNPLTDILQGLQIKPDEIESPLEKPPPEHLDPLSPVGQEQAGLFGALQRQLVLEQGGKRPNQRKPYRAIQRYAENVNLADGLGQFLFRAAKKKKSK